MGNRTQRIIQATQCIDFADIDNCYRQGFEHGYGGWAQYQAGDDRNWTLYEGSTISNTTGPTSGAGSSAHYLYTEASDGANNKTFSIISPCFDMTTISNPSLTFDYSMYGNTIGTLQVFVSTNGGSSWTSIFVESGNQGTGWQTANIDLNPYLVNDVRFRITATTGGDHRSDIAIDNIEIKRRTPDLLCGTSSLSITNNTVTIDPLIIENQGLGSSGIFELRIYLSTNTTISTSDFLVKTENLSSISGSSNLQLNNYTLTGGDFSAVPDGTYYIGFIIDAPDNILETDESNNICHFNSPLVTIGCTDAAAHNYNASANIDNNDCETCSDGIQNGDETGIDCGGLMCPSCCNNLTVSASATPETYCGARDGTATANASGGTPPYTYNWVYGYTGMSINNLIPGSYRVTVTDANNCQTSVIADVLGQTSDIEISINTTPELCDGVDGTVSATVSNGAAPYTYAWSNGATTASTNTLSSGVITLTVTDANNCTAQQAAYITHVKADIDDLAANYCDNNMVDLGADLHLMDNNIVHNYKQTVLVADELLDYRTPFDLQFPTTNGKTYLVLASGYYTAWTGCEYLENRTKYFDPGFFYDGGNIANKNLFYGDFATSRPIGDTPSSDGSYAYWIDGDGTSSIRFRFTDSNYDA
ncbi:MAG: choice-of-anchor J domain-containing protein, partial [Bacteroidota bacterium]